MRHVEQKTLSLIASQYRNGKPTKWSQVGDDLIENAQRGAASWNGLHIGYRRAVVNTVMIVASLIGFISYLSVHSL